MIDLDAIQARADAAFAGPWGYRPHKSNDKWILVMQIPGGHVSLVPARCRENAAFIAHARTDIPELIADVKRLRGLLNRALPWVTDFAFGEADSERVSEGGRLEVEQLREDMKDAA